MKDSILNSVLIAVTFAAIVFAAIDNHSATPQTVMSEASRVVNVEKTAVAVTRTPSDVTLVASAAR